jgi:hypothetical protein
MIKMMCFFMALGGMLLLITQLFNGAQGGVSTTLTAILLNTETGAMGVTTTSGFKSAGKVYVNNEVIRYTGVAAPGSCPSPIPALSGCFTGLTRSLGEIDASTHATGSRVYDETLGITNLQAQHGYSTFATDIDSGFSLTLNPSTWISAITNLIPNFMPTFLTGNWAYFNIIFGFFVGVFVLIVLALIASFVRGTRLF